MGTFGWAVLAHRRRSYDCHRVEGRTVEQVRPVATGRVANEVEGLGRRLQTGSGDGNVLSGAPARPNADVPPNPARTRGHGRQRSSNRESVTRLLEQEATASVRLTCGCSVEQGEARLILGAYGWSG